MIILVHCGSSSINRRFGPRKSAGFADRNVSLPTRLSRSDERFQVKPISVRKRKRKKLKMRKLGLDRKNKRAERENRERDILPSFRLCVSYQTYQTTFPLSLSFFLCVSLSFSLSFYITLSFWSCSVVLGLRLTFLIVLLSFGRFSCRWRWRWRLKTQLVQIVINLSLSVLAARFLTNN
jgi:hypothetical protein